jgi:hypothetical protein
MTQRVGILRVTIDQGSIRAEAGGQLSPQEWLFAIEMTRHRIISQVAKTSPIDLITRKVDRTEGAE